MGPLKGLPDSRYWIPLAIAGGVLAVAGAGFLGYILFELVVGFWT